MNKDLIISLTQNIAILMAFSYVFDFLKNNTSEKISFGKKIITGLLVSFISIVLMTTTFKLSEGLVFDTRSIVLSVSGLFFGFIPTLIAVIFSMAYRIYIGGSGVFMGLAVIISSGAVGVIWNKFFSKKEKKQKHIEYLLFGYIVHLLMLLCFLFLPEDSLKKTAKTLIIPLLTIYPIGTMLVSILVSKRKKNLENNITLRESQKRYKTLIEASNDGFVLLDKNGKIKQINQKYFELSGYTEKEIIGTDFSEYFFEKEQTNFTKRLFLILKNGFERFDSIQKNKNGEKWYVEISMEFLKIENGIFVLFLKDITERIQFLEKISLSEKRYRLISSLSTDYVFYSVVNEKNELVLDWISGAFENVTGYTIEEYKKIGGWRVCLHKDDIVKDDEDFENLLKNKPVKTELRTIHKSGEIVWVQVYAHPVWNTENCRLIGIYGSVTNITQKIEVELALKESVNRNLTLIKAIPDLIFRVNKVGVILDYNTPSPQKLLLEPKYFLNKNIIDILPKEIFEKSFQSIKNAVVKQQVSVFEYELNINGTSEYFEARVNIIPESDEVFFLIRDITDNKNLEIQIRMNEELFRKIFENSVVPIAIIGLDNTVVKANDAYARMLAYQKHELIGKSIFDFTAAEYINDNIELKNKLISGEIEHFLFEKKYIRKDNNFVFGVLHASLLCDSKNEPLYFISIVLDITDIKNVQSELITLNNELEKRVNERTTELQIANKDLESFVYSISHDLRAPLRHIGGFSKLLKNGLEQNKPNSLDYIGKIETAIKTMSTMIESLLSFSRLGRSSLVKSLIDLNELVEKVINRYRADIEEYKAQIITHKLPTIMADYNLILLVFDNLISNAIKFSSKKENPIIKIGFVKNNKSTIFVNDNGVGFNMAYANKLFNVFQRLHSQKEFEGTGIGLANVKQIVTKHGGNINVESEPNVGTTFYITFND